MAFYKLTRDSRRLEPRHVTPDQEVVTAMAPRQWWAYDILEEEGAKKFRDVVEEVKEMCSQISL
ncbi:hypothetical protein L226DRAFT_528110 [Lentinus tigrinus ALCF2SS1-7]|uniref:uncharacterized protein n=1 Tax=Lentinus tigrinus ALCF2SS1-7 TaxID=1328758 RepID=UPI001165E934|nr:hypothetical protein L226DRAFT_528110 [Lentinus tigrinus ALCF2SS1-7]